MRAFRPVLLVGLAAAVSACADDQPSTLAPNAGTSQAPLFHAAPSGQGIEGSYIVVLREGENPASVASAIGASPRFVYTAVVNGFAAELNQGQLRALQAIPAVEYVEQDQVMTADATQSNATWGIDRIDQRSLPLSGTYSYNATAGSVRAYIIDTGLDAGHAEFEGRAQNVYDAFGGNGNDCNGHGTHVGGTVGGKTYGVAKKALLRGVRVLDCNGSGSTSGIIAAVDWVRTNAIKPAIANMSLGGGKSSTLNSAVNNLSSSGIFVAVAAGNSNADACNYSPASASYAYTTAASTSTDYKASYSNYGSCVDGYAPGSSITSAWIGSGTTETRTINGTSMASPHIAGVAALYKANYGDVASSTIVSWINNNATGGVIKSNVTGTPNRLLFKSSL